ncbi:alpha/beta fold hydrolase [Actinomadura viridis]|uniref:Pimeloyl-ACP methyl ester carboxylesterase n=1 Tax=Actinomadura viridis TaxID=58110 RepID=A0A931DSC0_9ACTN|nr:alpha/beta hydrolase [Actinomadura viridis]MBG6092936.1 pimeloyl-ACP methyl ester carboxylesterase [Actinomadura viridis]
MSTFILVHGAWNQGTTWKKTLPILQAPGRTVLTPSLRADAGTRLSDHVTQVEELIAKASGFGGPVTLVAHSYAGVPASQAVIRSGGVDRLVLLDAWLAPAGKSLLDVAPDWFADWCRTSATGDPAMLPIPPLGSIGVPDDSAEAAWLGRRLVEHPLATFTDPVESTLDSQRLDALGVERHALLCVPGTMPFREFAIEAGCAIDEISSGHSVMVTRPVTLARRLLRLGS